MAQNSTDAYQTHKAVDEAQIEQQFLKGTREPDIGVYCDLFSAKSAFVGQDGGVVTALLAKGFKEGLFDAAIVVRRIGGYNAEAAVATNVEDAVAASGTKYLRVNVSGKLRELINQGKKRIAVVCTPCEAKAVRKIQQTLKQGCQITVIGLFCFEAFNREKLKAEINRKLGVDLDGLDKAQVRQGQFVVQVGDKKFACKVKDLDAAAEGACGFCDDFAAQFADVSVGSVGSREGYSTVVVRSDVGEKLVEKLEAAKDAVEKGEVARVARVKRERAKKTLTNQRKTV